MTLKDDQITINVTPGPAPVEEKYIIGKDLDYDAAISLAIQNRKTHQQEPVEVRKKGEGWQVIRVVMPQ